MSVQKSFLGGAIGAEINRLVEEINRITPLDSHHIRHGRGPSGTRSVINEALLRSGDVAVAIAQLGTISQQSATATLAETGESITVARPSHLYSYVDDRPDSPNWVPADGAVSDEDFHWVGKNSRYRIMHQSLEVYVDGGGGDFTADYGIVLEKIYPLYATNDYIIAFRDFQGNWHDLNDTGRYWKPQWQLKTSFTLSGGNYVVSGASPHPLVFAQPHVADDMVYSNDSPYWIDDTDD